jgi:predicted metal-dependent enzyme (double-stranded beta helix superfamily)
MCDTGYSVKRLVEDLRLLKARGGPEPALLEEVQECVKRLMLMKHNWLRSSMTMPSEEPQSAGVFQLHEEPDHSLAIFVVTWMPGEETPAHDHGTWAVVGGLEGWETQHRWKRLDDGSKPGYAEVVRDRSERIDTRTVAALDSKAIHSVQNDSGAKSVSLHVYGMHVDYTVRSQFDPARKTSAPYRLGATLAG